MAFVFTGLDEYSVDDRGRMLLPPAYKPALTDTVVIGLGASGQIWVYPKPTYQAYLEKLDATPLEERTASFYEAHRMIMAGQAVEFDKQGRISIPPFFRRMTGITNAAIVSGNGDRVELWKPERFMEEIGVMRTKPEKPADNPVLLRTGFHL
jgi:MraZ protein